MTTRRRRPSRAALVATAGVVAITIAGCTSPAGSQPPTLDRAIEAADTILDHETRIENVLIAPHAGSGSSTFEMPDRTSGGFFKMNCLGEGVVTVRVDGSDRFTEQRCDDGTVGVGLDGDAKQVQLLAGDDVYWVATAYTQTPS